MKYLIIIIISNNQSCGAKFTFGTGKLVPLTLDFNTPVLQGCRFGTMEPQVVPKDLVWCQERFLVPDNSCWLV